MFLRKQPKVENLKQQAIPLMHNSQLATDVPLHSVALQRLIDEVRNEKDAPLTGYNRVYNRHNR
jgi:hypothetical protein